MLGSLARPEIARGLSANVGPLGAFWSGAVSQRSHAGIPVTADVAVQLSVIFRAINVRAHAVASCPLIVYKHKDEDGKERARTHPQYGLLHDKPNAYMTSFRWRHLSIAQKILWGAHYSEIITGPTGAIAALNPLSPRVTRVVDQLADGRLLYVTRDEHVTTGGVTYGRERRLTQDEVFHLRGFSLDGRNGLPLSDVARNAIGLALAAEKHGSMFLRRGQQFAGILSSDLPMDQSAREENEKAWQRARGGPDGSGGTPMITGMKYTPISATNKESQWVESRSFQVEELLRFIGVPGVLCGYSDKTATYASAEQMFLSFVVHTVTPDTEDFAQELNFNVVTGAPDYFADFVLAGLLKGDIKTRYAAHESAIRAGWKNRNQVRVEESYNRGPDALDVYLEPLNTAPAGSARDLSNDDDSNADGNQNAAVDDRMLAIVRRSAERLARKETAAMLGTTGKLGAAKRFAGDPTGWLKWLGEFYESHAASLSTDLNISVSIAANYGTSRVKQFSGGIAGMNDIAAFEKEAAIQLTRLALAA